ncbi:MAG: hypothetical protein AB7P17_13765 [Nitrospirales bacterium]|nr:hypothetical protein [Nitrospirales bacterium]
MKSLVVYTTVFALGVGVGIGAPTLLSRYAQPYLPTFLQQPAHPLEGTVTHKQRDQERLLMTVTTAHGTILATFKKQVPEIDLLVEERDSVTLDVRQYEPFVNDPPVLKVDKHTLQEPIPLPSLSTSMESAHRPESPMDSTPPPREPSMEPEASIPSQN